MLALALAVGCNDGARPPGGQPAGQPTAAAVPEAGAAVRFLALGDSFTIGTGATPERSFPARLAARWRTSSCLLTLENVAVNGFTTDDVITVELPHLATFHPTFVTVAIGANDIVRGTSDADYRANVRRILDAAKGTGARVVALPQPDWSRSPAAASFGTPEALAARITRFNAVLTEEARATNAEWVDLVPLMQEQARRGDLASDGLHPSASAYDAWAMELARVLTSPCAGQ